MRETDAAARGGVAPHNHCTVQYIHSVGFFFFLSLRLSDPALCTVYLHIAEALRETQHIYLPESACMKARGVR